MKKNRRLPNPLLFSRRDCAELLGCGLNKIDDAIKSNALKSFLWGGDRKIHSKDLWEFAWTLRESGLSDDGLEV